MGTRHRAGISLSEETDALVIIVSEESGAISLCDDGQITRFLDPVDLNRLLREGLRLSDDEDDAKEEDDHGRKTPTT